MPQLIFKGVRRNDVQQLSETLVKPLATIANAPESYFTFEYIETSYFFGGHPVQMYPLIEIIQYDRGEQVEKDMAQCVGDQVKALGYDTVEVYFTSVGDKRYFEF